MMRSSLEPPIAKGSRPTSRRTLLAVSVSVVVLGGLTAAWVGAVGTTRYVDDNTCPAIGSGTQADPYCHIQDAICIAAAGDTISVAPGNYPEAIRMKPDVSVISQGGAAVTTINAAGQPCTDNTFCAKRTGNQCSVVTFASGHTNATTFQGFTVTGGAGLIQTTKVAGGGIFVFSSPTIVNNVITNNILSGPSPQGKDLRGAGVYVAVGTPVISNNTITGNRAVPPAGASGAVTFGYGGGMWLGFQSAAVVTNNVIQGNRAGDPNLTYSIGAGGGLVVFPPGTTLGPVVDRNLIADNITDSEGGGVALESTLGTTAPAVVSNNVIVGNNAHFGGGVYTYFNKSTTVNNTITGNEAFLGGGLYSGQSDTTLPVAITNNIIEGNNVRQFGTGGGIYTLDLSATFDPTINFNDLFGNTRNQCAGDQTDATCIGVNGNFSSDPRFIDKAGRDYHLDPNSPAIDRGTTSSAPPVDKDNNPRGVDGNGIPNNPQPGDIDVGAFERQPSCVPVPEICDNLDNNCNGSIDEGLGSTTCGVGACQRTTQNCVGGVTQTCTPGSPSTEVCDGVDNDCNGSTDEGLGSTTCGVGACQRTTQNCLGGVTQTCTPGSPSTEVCDGLDNDCNGSTDEGLGSTTCGVGACQRTTQNCVGGLIQSCTPGAPSTEVCDGIDNNCNGAIDEGFPNTDGDAMPDCLDPDDDNDGVADASDCAPLDATAFGSPFEITGLDVPSASPTMVTYDPQSIGSGTHYEVIAGLLGRLVALRNFSESFCTASYATGGSWMDTRPAPPVGDGWYYMARSANACGLGTYGTPLRDAPGSGNSCQIGRVDADGDGSPADLDCNDADPTLSPVTPEVCDGRDNNCNQIADENNPGGGQSCGSSVGACSPGTTVCSNGSLSCQGGVGPATEICDGLDNDCDGLIDNSMADFDHDGLTDCVDPDDDNDSVDDTSDCAPMDATAFAAPSEVQDMDILDLSPTQITWTNQTLGTGTIYDIATGQLTGAGLIDFAAGTCLTGTPSSPGQDARPAPPANTAWYYMVKSRNACGPGTYGTPARDAHPACP